MQDWHLNCHEAMSLHIYQDISPVVFSEGALTTRGYFKTFLMSVRLASAEVVQCNAILGSNSDSDTQLQTLQVTGASKQLEQKFGEEI